MSNSSVVLATIKLDSGEEGMRHEVGAFLDERSDVTI